MGEKMEKKRLLFIYNPKAGKSRIKGKLPDIIEVFVKGGYEVTVYPTQYCGDAARATCEKDGVYDLVVCSGGDGTLDEVVTGMLRSGKQVPIGYIPAGSTNDFAGSLHLPADMIKAAHVAIEGKKFACDMGSFNDDTFVYIAAFGIFTDVSYGTRQEMKNALGHMAYILEGMKRLPAVKAQHLKVICGGRQIEDDFIFGMVTNSLSVGGFKRITGKFVELDDGEFEVTLIRKPNSVLELNEIMAALINRDIDTEYMYCFKTSELQVVSEQEVPWTLDGEFGGNHREVSICNRKRAVEILVPPKK